MGKTGICTSRNQRWSSRVAVAVAGVVVSGTALVGPAQAVPLFPGGPEIPTLPGLPSAPQLPLPEPAPAPANFSAPSLNPGEGEVVGVAQPVIIRFNEAIGDRAAAERAIKVTTSQPVEGGFYWINDSQVRWKPTDFWPANTRCLGGDRRRQHQADHDHPQR
jgi:lipoprotein-anchoring transpeptidase ErfK/SrfK